MIVFGTHSEGSIYRTFSSVAIVEKVYCTVNRVGMAALANSSNNNGEGAIDPEQNFEVWLKSLKISDTIINKLKDSDMDSVYA